MVIADGIVQPQELSLLYRLGIENYDVTPEQINQWIVSSGSSFGVPEKLEDKVLILYQLSQIAWADGTIDESERAILIRYIKHLGFKPENAEEISNYMIERVHEGLSFDEVLNAITNN